MKELITEEVGAQVTIWMEKNGGNYTEQDIYGEEEEELTDSGLLVVFTGNPTPWNPKEWGKLKRVTPCQRRYGERWW
jgi:hypothetical protein